MYVRTCNFNKQVDAIFSFDGIQGGKKTVKNISFTSLLQLKIIVLHKYLAAAMGQKIYRISTTLFPISESSARRRRDNQFNFMVFAHSNYNKFHSIDIDVNVFHFFFISHKWLFFKSGFAFELFISIKFRLKSCA